MKRVSLVAIAALSLWAAPVTARPSFWDAVSDPRTVVAARALRAADQARIGSIPGSRDPMTEQVLSLQAAVLVELAGGAELPSTELRFFYGDALVWAHAGKEAEGRRILRELVAEYPEHPLAARAWFAIAIASSWLRDRATEDLAYTRALHLQWDPEMRSRIYLNRAETRMLAGDLTAAKRDYEHSLALAVSSEGHALAQWGLAVLLAREGNLLEALQHARRATALRLPGSGGRSVYAIDLPGVFFSPSYEIHYYRALGAMAEAGALGDDPEQAISAYERALSEWDEYLRRGREAKDPWLSGATQQRAYCRARLEAVRAAATSGAHR